MFRLVAFACLLAAAYGTGKDIICRCQGGKAMYSQYPTILSCMIPNSKDWVSSFVENDSTWNPDHEFPAGDNDCDQMGPCQWCSEDKGSTDSNGDCQPGQVCKKLKTKQCDATSGWWICELFSPKCWYDAGRVENSIWNGKYGCADNDLPNPAIAGAICKILCAAGYTMKGGPATCRGGKWTNFPRCDQAGCAGMPPCTGGGCTGWTGPCLTKQASYAARTQCDPTCKDGWKVGGEATCVMGKNGKPEWEAATCIAPPPPNPPVPPPKNCARPDWDIKPHGKWDCKNTKHGQTCSFSCGPGFKKAGNPPKCNNGKYDQAHPSTMPSKQKAHCACKDFQHIGPNTPPACVFGGYSGVDRLDFVADVSGSMRAGMKAGGKKYTRIAYLKIALKDAIDSLDSDQMFNVIKYSTTCSPKWQTGVVKATKANKALADSFVNSFSASGGTNMNCGLALAAKDPKVQGIFLLTDGEPTIKMSGLWGPYGSAKPENRNNPYGTIKSLIGSKQWPKKVQVNPISFYAPRKRYGDLDWVAKKTGGKHHKIV